MSQPAPERRIPSGNWASLFSRATDAVFVLNRRRQIRYVNPAWEALVGQQAAVVRGLFCLPRASHDIPDLQSLARFLSPPPEVLQGNPASIRKLPPGAKLGPPWWDVRYLPIREGDSFAGIVGTIIPIGEPIPPGGGMTEPLVAIRERIAASFNFRLLDSETPAMRRVAAQAQTAGRVLTPVWITGGPGSGKETLARIIHFQGITRERTFLAIDARMLPAYSLHGLFGVESIDGLGTLFLRNPDALPDGIREMVLNAAEEPHYRIIVAHDGGEVPESSTLANLYARLSLFEIRLPALKERKADLPRLVEWLLSRESTSASGVSDEAMQAIAAYDWPGNIRQLTAVLREARREGEGTRMELADLPRTVRESLLAQRMGRPVVNSLGRPNLGLDEALERVEVKFIRLALQQAKGNKAEAAELLGIPRARLFRRIEALKLEEETGQGGVGSSE